ncbi:MAG: hypothetical protein HGA94_05735, partial [Candidatus Aminicenantes bacterium]|nr:hypothetical protein [Candidatus Aminicenantes bacterium]
MSKKSLEAALARGVEILNKFLPLKSWLVFPVLYSACVWAVRRVFDFRERILAWQVWLEPDFVRTKPDEFVLAFFCGHEALGREYADEIARGDMRVLRAAFPEFELRPASGMTVLRGQFVDQAALHGVIERINALGLDLVSLKL